VAAEGTTLKGGGEVEHGDTDEYGRGASAASAR